MADHVDVVAGIVNRLGQQHDRADRRFELMRHIGHEITPYAVHAASVPGVGTDHRHPIVGRALRGHGHMQPLRISGEFELPFHRRVGLRRLLHEIANAGVHDQTVHAQATFNGRLIRDEHIGAGIGDDDGLLEHRKHAAFAIHGIGIGMPGEQRGLTGLPLALPVATGTVGDGIAPSYEQHAHGNRHGNLTWCHDALPSRTGAPFTSRAESAQRDGPPYRRIRRCRSP